MLRGTRLLLAVVACALALPAAASAKVWIVKGAGFGHGVCLSQYGAYGYAKHGFTYNQILAHYYTGTTLGTTGAHTVHVLLRANAGSVSFSGASSACGVGLTPSASYVATRSGASIVLSSATGGQV